MQYEGRDTATPVGFTSPGSESGFLRCLRHEGAEKWPKGFPAALRALDLPLFMFADGQGERHFAVTFVAVVLVDRHGRPSLVIWDRSADPGLTSERYRVPYT